MTDAERLRVIAKQTDRLANSLRRVADAGGVLEPDEILDTAQVVDMIGDYAAGRVRRSPSRPVPEPQSLRVGAHLKAVE